MNVNCYILIPVLKEIEVVDFIFYFKVFSLTVSKGALCNFCMELNNEIHTFC